MIAETFTKLISLLCILVAYFETIKPIECGGGVKIIVVDNTYNNSQVKTDNDFDGVSLSNSPNSINEGSKTEDKGATLLKPETSINHIKSPIRCSRYFGMFFAPYVRSDAFQENDYTTDSIKKMLKVTLTKATSILTVEMGYQLEGSDDNNGHYDTTTPSRVAVAAAELNLEADIPLITLSQGASYPMWNHTSTSEYDAALYSANRANSIFPGTVWSITIHFTSLISKGSDDTFNKIMYHAQPFSKRVHAMNLKFGLYIYPCEKILTLKHPLFTLENLRKLTSLTDFLICTIYPSKPVSDVKNYFHTVRSSFESVKREFVKYAPKVKLYLYTGWASYKWSVYNPPQMNSPMKTKQFWDMVEPWAEETKQKVFMNSAFDYFLNSDENGFPTNKYYYGYFKRADNSSDDKYIVKGTGEVLTV